MRKSFVALLLLMGAAAALASTASARVAEDLGGDNPTAKLINAQMVREMRSAVAQTGVSGAGVNTTYVGYVPGKVTATNYWGIGVGCFQPRTLANTGTVAGGFGYWSWDNDPGFIPGNPAAGDHITEVHGDSLFGWWPYINLYTSTGGLVLADDQRPWWAIDIGNNANYVINQGTAHKRTYGVVGVWHVDGGNTGGGAGQGVQWTPLGGSFSLWCGLRRDQDVSNGVDPVTKNPWNARVLYNSGVAGGVTGLGIGTNQKFPGYGSQWDQMAYRDINVTGASTVTLRFKYRTNMSTGYGTANGTRTGWFNKDPLDHHWATSAPNNFISSTAAQLSAPIDSFMVYVGGPVGYAAGSNFVGSDNGTHQVYDAQRRWFSEVLRVNEASVPYYELLSTYGDDTTFRATQFVSSTVSVSGSWGGKARIVFRNKTNRGFDDEGVGGAVGAYASNGLGAVVIDDVDYSTNGGGSWTPYGSFETPGAGGSVDNATNVDPLTAWKTTGKPPAIFHHVHDITDLIYEDLCGPVGSSLRICNLQGNVISAGDHDNSEGAGGTFDTAYQERLDGLYSPTFNLMSGPSATPNEMGINASIATVTEDYYVEYDLYTGVFDFVTQGNAWRFGWSTWPGKQLDGQKCWADWRFPGFIIFNPDKQCFQDQEPAIALGLMKWNSAAAEGGAVYPDSIRMYLGKVQQCFRFGITTGCNATDGAYWDNVSLAFVDGVAPPMSVDIWQLINDTFTVNGGLNRANVLPGSSNFDTTTALVKIGLNITQTTNSTSRYTVPGDTTTVQADGNDFRMDLVFRVNPGPGNYVTAGTKASGLRKVPTSVTPATSGNTSNFWESYLFNNGLEGTPVGHPGGGVNGKTWSNLVWNSARMDTTEQNIFAISGRNLGGPVQGLWSTMYNELDPKYTTLGIAKNRCFLLTATSGVTFANTTCDIGLTDGWPITAGYTAENSLPLGQTYEYTKILPDGQFTPGTHVEYFFRREDTGGSGGPCEGAPNACFAPDTNTVFPQPSEGSTDSHRWQEFSVLPDAWKKTAYGGLGQACMLYVDLNDRRGNERVWVSIADSIGSTSILKYGAHNGWHAPGTGTAAVNLTSSFVRNKNEQPGTTWDMFGVKASESLNSKAGTIGVWNSNHAASNVDQKWSYLGPSIGMLEAYYKVLLILSGDLNSAVLGPSNDFGANDCKMIQDFLAGGISGDPRGVFIEGDGFVESVGTLTMQNLMVDWFKVDLRDPSYGVLSKNTDQCADLVTSAPISAIDVYGVRNGCTFTDDVLLVQPGGAEASHYSPRGVATAPVVSGVYHAVTGSEFYYSLVDGWDIENLRSRFCDRSNGRLAYYYNSLTNIFGLICTLAGSAGPVTDVPQGGAQEVVDFMNLRNNPLVAGQATVDFGLSKSDRVEVKVFDVSGRLVRTLADRQFAAGRHSLTWDGVDDGGRQVARGVYFTQVKYVNSRFTDAKKLTVLK